jgi:hypothetical protein
MQSIKVFLFFTILCINSVVLYASPSQTAKTLHLIPGKKAIIQWERVFKSERKMKKYGIDKLSEEERVALKKYLLDHAADSDHPTVAGDM